jgi:hypothetical protein
MTRNCQPIAVPATNVYRIKPRKSIDLSPDKRFRNWQQPIPKYRYCRHGSHPTSDNLTFGTITETAVLLIPASLRAQ